MSRVRVLVDSRIVIRELDIPAEVATQLKADFTHVNPQREMLRRIGKPFWAEPKEIVTWAQDDEFLTFPRGGMDRVRERLAEAGLKRHVVDERESGALAELPEHRVKLHEFQEVTAGLCLTGECGIIRAPTGSGKTTIAFAVASRAQLATLVIVYNVGLFDQWVKRAKKELGLEADELGVIRGSKRKLRPLTIAMQQTLSARGVDEQMQAYFGMVIVDEVHRAAAATMYSAVDPFPARYRIGISADHRRKDRREFLTEDLFGKVVDDVSRKELIKSGHVLEVQIRVIPTDFEAPWYGMPTEKNGEGEQVETGMLVDTTRLNRELGEDFARNQLGLSIVIDEQAEGEQVLVFSHVREHCMVLDQSLVARHVRTGFLIGGEDYRREFRKTIAGLESGDVRVGVGTFQAVGQALDMPTVAVGVCMTPIASNRQFFNQVRGRFCRTSVGKTSARLYYLWDHKVFGRKHLANIVAWNADVVVQDSDGRWVEGRQYLKRLPS